MVTIEAYKRELAKLIQEREDQKIILKLIDFSKEIVSNDNEFDFSKFIERQKLRMENISKRIEEISKLLNTLEVVIQQQDDIDKEIRKASANSSYIPGQVTDLYKEYSRIEQCKVSLHQRIERLF